MLSFTSMLRKSSHTPAKPIFDRRPSCGDLVLGEMSRGTLLEVMTDSVACADLSELPLLTSFQSGEECSASHDERVSRLATTSCAAYQCPVNKRVVKAKVRSMIHTGDFTYGEILPANLQPYSRARDVCFPQHGSMDVLVRASDIDLKPNQVFRYCPPCGKSLRMISNKAFPAVMIDFETS